MPSILKYYQQSTKVESYEYSNDFDTEKILLEEEQQQEQQATSEVEDLLGIDLTEEKPENSMKEVGSKVNMILEEARKKADEIIQEAQAQALEIKEQAAQEGKKEGFEEGYQSGYEQAYEENKEKMENEYTQTLKKLESIIKEVSNKKTEIIHQYKGDLKDIAVAVGEKVIQVSLKSSGQVIEKMIISATEKLKRKEWAKIYIAKCDADLMIEADIDILRGISHISRHLKVIAMDGESPGTCIIELPDEIIDASVNTQVENIKGILNSAGL